MTRDDISNLLAEFSKSANFNSSVHMHSVNLNVHDKVFAFAHREGIALKLPPERVQSLNDAGKGTNLVMGTKTMKNWALITRANATAYRKELPLILEAHAYVAAEAATKLAKKKTQRNLLRQRRPPPANRDLPEILFSFAARKSTLPSQAGFPLQVSPALRRNRVMRIRALIVFAACASLLPFAYAQTSPDPRPIVEISPQIRVHRITPRPVIHADDPPEANDPSLTPIQRAMHHQDLIFNNMLSVDFEVVVNENGRVESAHPISGPQRFYAQAEDLELHQAFTPIRVNGQIVRAKFTDGVALYPTERWSPKPVPFPAQVDLKTLSLSLARTSCFGSCPAYTLTIAGNGDVTFTTESSYSSVATPGTHHAHIPPDAVRDLLSRFRQANFLSALDQYQCGWTDMPTETLTLTLNGITKSVIDYGGETVGLPDSISALEEDLDHTADSERWIKGNVNTIPSLHAEHWNFASPGNENLTLYDSAITALNHDLIHEFTAARAPIASTDPKIPSPICAASLIGYRDLVSEMLAAQPAKAKLPQPVLDQCLSNAARSGNPELTQLWLTHGAHPTIPRPSAKDDEDDGPPLTIQPIMSAIQSGNPDVVAMLLSAHASVTSKANDDRSLPAFALQHALTNDEHVREKILSLLIQAGADINETTSEDPPAIFATAYAPGAIPILLAAGADINAHDNRGQTPLIANAYMEPSVKALLDAGADPTLRDHENKSALDHARQSGCTACITLLEAAINKRVPGVTASSAASAP
jgi:ankyrin repeat protein